MTNLDLWVAPMAAVAFVCSVSSIVISILDRGAVTRNRSHSGSEEES